MEATAGLDFEALTQRFDGPGVRAIVLMGSRARGDAGPDSDVDLVRLMDGEAEETRTELIAGRLVVVGSVGPAAVEEWFSSPVAASATIAGLRMARPLLDRDGAFAAIQARAWAFTWDAAMQQKANAYASRQMAGWIEEVHKGLEGLRRGDIGRMLNAQFGLSWGLSTVVQVQRGVLLSGDNGFYDEVAEAVGRDSRWVRLRRAVFGIAEEGGAVPSLPEQVVAGLHLYAVTAEMLADAFAAGDRPLIFQTVARIRAAYGEGRHA